MKKTLSNSFCVNDLFYEIKGDGIPSSFVVNYNYKSHYKSNVILNISKSLYKYKHSIVL